MKIMLHICCGPCATYSAERLGGEGHDVTGFFYNPNIHPFTEFKNRLESLKKYSAETGLNVVFDDEYNLDKFFDAIEHKSQGRCPHCYRMRLERTATAAKENRCNAFTTTLLISPYQDHEQIKRIGEEIAAGAGVEFYYEDFRSGFRTSHEFSKKHDLYRQKYCGCIFSEYDRYKPKQPGETK